MLILVSRVRQLVLARRAGRQVNSAEYIIKMEKVTAKMREAGLNQAAIDAFQQNYDQLVAGVTGLVRRPALQTKVPNLVSAQTNLTDNTACWQVSEKDIEAIDKLPRLDEQKRAEEGDLKVGIPASALPCNRSHAFTAWRAATFAACCHRERYCLACRSASRQPDLSASPAEPQPCCVLQTLLSQTAVLKLNGGLGTSMGLEKAKSLLEVKDGKTFLDLIAEQIKYTRKKYGSQVGPVWSSICCLAVLQVSATFFCTLCRCALCS